MFLDYWCIIREHSPEPSGGKIINGWMRAAFIGVSECFLNHWWSFSEIIDLIDQIQFVSIELWNDSMFRLSSGASFFMHLTLIYSNFMAFLNSYDVYWGPITVFSTRSLETDLLIAMRTVFLHAVVVIQAQVQVKTGAAEYILLVPQLFICQKLTMSR